MTADASTRPSPATGTDTGGAPSPRPTGILSRGVLAGIVGATILAVWFLVIDGTRGEPFHTPAFLAGALLGLENVRPSTGLVVLYTLVHFGLWALLGVILSGLLAAMRVSWPVLMGIVLGFFLFDLVFYLSIIVNGADIVAELGWPAVLAGNVLAGVGTFTFLHMVGATARTTAWDLLRNHRLVREGVVGGLVGAAVVAVWFLVFDLARGEPFFTPGALGSAFFLGADSLADVRVEAGTVAAYTVLHVVAFIFLGFAAAAVVMAAEKVPSLLIGAVLAFAAFEAFFMAALAIVAQFLLGPLAWWTIAVGNVLAAGAMAAYLWHSHPGLREALRRGGGALADERAY